MQVSFLRQEDSLEKEMATHSSILAWRIPWTEEPGGLQSMASQSLTRLSDWAHTRAGPFGWFLPQYFLHLHGLLHALLNSWGSTAGFRTCSAGPWGLPLYSHFVLQTPASWALQTHLPLLIHGVGQVPPGFFFSVPWLGISLKAVNLGTCRTHLVCYYPFSPNVKCLENCCLICFVCFIFWLFQAEGHFSFLYSVLARSKISLESQCIIALMNKICWFGILNNKYGRKNKI